jgi:hypothetical protein
MVCLVAFGDQLKCIGSIDDMRITGTAYNANSATINLAVLVANFSLLVHHSFWHKTCSHPQSRCTLSFKY